jgi:hypothetical protein
MRKKKGDLAMDFFFKNVNVTKYSIKNLKKKWQHPS